MSVKILSVAKQLPKYTRDTKDIIPFVKLWMQGHAFIACAIALDAKKNFSRH